MGKMDEIVWAIRTDELFEDRQIFNGYMTPPDQIILGRIYKNCIPLTRGECEENPTFKHIN